MYRTAFMTNITPLPPSIPRDVAVACLHNHSEMIGLNPLVIRQQPTTAPSNATLEEQISCVWYEITDVINYGFTKGEVSYKAGFYDIETGIQTRVFAPAGVDIKATWKVKGNMLGDPPAAPELGVDVPTSGLYIREDIELKCNMFLMSFVKRNLRKPHTKLVGDLIAMAEGANSTKTKSAASTSPLTSQTSKNPEQQTDIEPCSCPENSHRVMCPNYRYGAAPAESSRNPMGFFASGSSQPAINADPAELYSPADAHPDTVDHRAFQTLQSMSNPQTQVLRKSLPASPPDVNSDVPYTSPQPSGEHAVLSAVVMSRGEARADAAISELDGTEVAYWRTQQGPAELE